MAIVNKSDALGYKNRNGHIAVPFGETALAIAPPHDHLIKSGFLVAFPYFLNLLLDCRKTYEAGIKKEQDRGLRCGHAVCLE